MPIVYLASKVVCNLAAFLLPAYLSFKAIRTRELKEVVPWLMYWIVLALFSVFEFITDLFVFWLPWYYELKTLFVLWLILPQTRGHIFLYRNFVHPALKKHEKKIDEAIVDAHSKALEASSELSRRSLQILKQYANDSLNSGASYMSDQLRSRATSAPSPNVRRSSRKSIPNEWTRPPRSRSRSNDPTAAAEANLVDEIKPTDYMRS